MDCPECENFKGRWRDTCLGRGLEGRPNPPAYAVEDFRRKHPGICNAEIGQSDHKPGITGGTVKMGAGGTPKEWDVSQPSRGLGDVVAKITHATGIDKIVKAVTGKKDCGCKKRQAALNQAVPFGG